MDDILREAEEAVNAVQRPVVAQVSPEDGFRIEKIIAQRAVLDKLYSDIVANLMGLQKAEMDWWVEIRARYGLSNYRNYAYDSNLKVLREVKEEGGKK